MYLPQDYGFIDERGLFPDSSFFTAQLMRIDRHWSEEELRRLVAGHFPGDPAVAIMHFARCARCAGLFERATGDRGRQWLAKRVPSPVDQGRPEDVGPLGLPRLDLLSDEEVAEGLRAGDLADELEYMERSARLLRARNTGRYRSLALGWELLHRSRRFWRDRPDRAEELAETAVAVFGSCRCSGDRKLAPAARDGLARAWGTVANARRVQGRLTEAAEALKIAERHLQRGTGDAEELGWWLRFKASLTRDARSFDEALSSCRGAQRAFASAGCLLDTAWMEIQEGVIEGESGRLAESVEVLEQFLTRRSVQEVGSEVYSLAIHNLSVRLAQMGRGCDAREVFRSMLECSTWATEPVTGLRVRWTEGLILEAEGRLVEAEGVFAQVQERFAARCLTYDAALVSLDLVRVLLRRGALNEVCEIADGLETIFQSVGVHREATAAGLYLVEALRRQRASVTLVSEVLDFLKKARRDPSFKFVPPFC